MSPTPDVVGYDLLIAAGRGLARVPRLAKTCVVSPSAAGEMGGAALAFDILSRITVAFVDRGSLEQAALGVGAIGADHRRDPANLISEKTSVAVRESLRVRASDTGPYVANASYPLSSAGSERLVQLYMGSDREGRLRSAPKCSAHGGRVPRSTLWNQPRRAPSSMAVMARWHGLVPW
jgi:hypothetical protein